MSALLHWDEAERETSRGPVSKQTIEGEGMILVRVAIKAGTVAERHSHRFEQFVQVIEGAGQLTTAEGTKAFGAGSVFHFLPDVWHAARFEADTILVESNLIHREA